MTASDIQDIQLIQPHAPAFSTFVNVVFIIIAQLRLIPQKGRIHELRNRINDVMSIGVCLPSKRWHCLLVVQIKEL